MADLIISQPMTFTVDVRNGLVERPQRESLMRGDKMANRIIAELMYGSEPFDITGVTVKGVFCRPPNGDEIELYGEAEGNVARVQLTDQCYTSGGHYEARVILEFNGVERTVLFISGDVLKSGSGNTAGNEETGGTEGNTGSGLPTGGTAGQVLVKVSSAQGDAIWKSLTAADVGARPNTWVPTAEDVGAQPAGDYALKSEIPEAYTLPTATADTLGGVKSSDAVTVNSDGTMSVNQLNGKDADEYLLKTDAFTMELVWTNEAPSSVFPQQPIVLDTTKYDGFLWQMKSWNGTAYISTWLTMDTKIQKYHTLFAVSDKSYISRSIEIRDGEIYANMGRSMDIATATFIEDNKYAVPVKLYGIKGVGA